MQAPVGSSYPHKIVSVYRQRRHAGLDNNGRILPDTSLATLAKAKFHYALLVAEVRRWSQTGPRLVADLQRAGIWPII